MTSFSHVGDNPASLFKSQIMKNMRYKNLTKKKKKSARSEYFTNSWARACSESVFHFWKKKFLLKTKYVYHVLIMMYTCKAEKKQTKRKITEYFWLTFKYLVSVI